MSEKTFAISGQHYLFSVQTFAHTILAAGGTEFDYALRDRTFKGVVDDVLCGASALGVLYKSSVTSAAIDAALDKAGLEFHSITKSAPCVALPAVSHPLVNAKSLRLEDLADYPYIYFEQEDDAPFAFYEEALSEVPRAKKIACTDRATLSELIAATNGYTITSGILVGITDGTLLTTVPLETSVTLELGVATRKDEELEGLARHFVEILRRNLDRYARL